MADVATSEIQVYDLPTKTVHLTPTGATVVREINKKIQPGLNEIIFLGIDPNVDVDSIRIEGSGPATITDTQTEIVPRRLLFEDVYGEEGSDDDGSTSDSEDPKSTELKSFRVERENAEDRLQNARNDERTAVQVLGFMDAYGQKMHPEHTESSNLENFIERYIERCATENERHRKAMVQVSKEEKEIESLSKKIMKLELQRRKCRDKSQRERAQEKSQELRKRQERQRFWTTSVGQVTVHLDSHSFTPGSSRRSSFSVVDKAADSPAGDSSDDRQVTLRLSYVVPGAKWFSRYELSINTPSSTAQVTYGAEFQNKSSETWSDARVTLSTSQTSFSGLHESIPSLQVWHVKLISPENDSNEQPSWEKIVRSLSEGGRPVLNSRAAQQDYEMQLALLEQQNRRVLMARQEQNAQAQMAPQAPASPRSKMAPSPFSQQGRPMGGRQPGPPPPAGNSLFESAASSRPSGGSLFGQQPQAAAWGGLFGGQAPGPVLNQMLQQAASAEPLQAPAQQLHQSSTTTPTNLNQEEDDDEILSPPTLDYQDSTRQEYGLTTTYDLPGHRTLVPSSVNRRHALAKLDLKSVTLQHVIVPKHRAAAFFRARIRNTTTIQILCGRVGMTVDGAFLGTTTMPNCAPNDFFDISLGVDPSILVTYAKPTVRRETSGGFFGKEDMAIFQRSCWVKNTKSTAANIIMLDQVPMSNDEKLQMTISQPKGLTKEGDKVPIAVEADKGKGVVTMGKDGELKWMLQLEPGKDVRIVLVYEMKAPRENDVSMS